MPEAIEDMLANTSLFARVDRVHLGEIAAWVQLQTFDTGQAIEREGELGTALHVIRSGGVDVYQGYGSDNQQHLASFGRRATSSARWRSARASPQRDDHR